MELKKLLPAVLVAAGLSACGGDGSSSRPSAQQKAWFVDNAVEGLQYRCGQGAVQLTGAQGALQCPPGSDVTFSVGSVVLGSATLVQGGVFITPAHLAGEGADEHSDMVTNLSRFLISLDADQQLENGIQLAPQSRAVTDLALDFSLAPEDFAASAAPVVAAMTQALEGGPFALVDAEDARSHVVLALFLSNAGYYEGEVRYSAEGPGRRLAFIASRGGAVYGAHLTNDGRYAHAGFDEELPEHLSSTGTGSSFKVDGSTGATLLLDVALENGRAEGALPEQAYPIFSASRELVFEPVVEAGLLDRLQDLLPMRINLGREDDPRYFGLDNEFLWGVPLSSFELSPEVEGEVEPLEYSTINVAEIVSGREGVLRLIALSMNGYVVDVAIDLNGETPSVAARWRHLYQNLSGTSTAAEFNIELD